ncbi:MAG: hypothetical protein HFI63_00835 [Lachnospiraceae bacterium]|nr:hypothetical protein [Lachnospiraceae bacterium]
MSKKEHFKILMVNSFKGGTGKTSVALSHCLYEWRRGQERLNEEEIYYDNIFFVDIDRLGTSMSYYLFPEETNRPIYFEEYEKKKIEDICNEVKFSGSNNQSRLYAVLLNPVANRKQDYSAHSRMQQHGRIYHTMFLNDFLSFIKECIKMGGNDLFVIDCSPGLSEMECRLLGEFYKLREEYKGNVHFSVEELYVTTFENGQIQKTVECLNEDLDLMYRENREVGIVLNDMQNCIGVEKGESDFHVEWEAVAQKILEKLENPTPVKIRYRKYQVKQMKAGIVGNVRDLNDKRVRDAYMLLKEYREDYISKDRMDGK